MMLRWWQLMAVNGTDYSLPQQLANGAFRLINRQMRVSIARGVGVGDRDASKWLSRKLDDVFIALIVEQGVRNITDPILGGLHHRYTRI
jgi:hypothetical protein